jgi:hypothetical protein
MAWDPESRGFFPRWPVVEDEAAGFAEASADQDVALGYVVLEQAHTLVDAIADMLGDDAPGVSAVLSGVARDLARAAYEISDPLDADRRHALSALARTCPPAPPPQAGSPAEWALILALHADAILARLRPEPLAARAGRAVDAAIDRLAQVFEHVSVSELAVHATRAGHFEAGWQHRELVPAVA